MAQRGQLYFYVTLIRIVLGISRDPRWTIVKRMLKALLPKALISRTINHLISGIKLPAEIDHYGTTHLPAVALYFMGFKLVHEGQMKRAIVYLERARELDEKIGDWSYDYYLGLAYLAVGEFKKALTHYDLTISARDDLPHLYMNAGSINLIIGRECTALRQLRRGIKLDPTYAIAHQNLAARYEREGYQSTGEERKLHADNILFDGYNLAGERVTHVGRGKEGVELFGRALKIQKRLAEGYELPGRLAALLAEQDHFDPSRPTRILSFEWVTQIGHLAMLDSYRKIQLLGWRPNANLVLLAPPDLCANEAYLDCWRAHFTVVQDANLIRPLYPLQRRIGDCFNAYLEDDERCISWPGFAARAQTAWSAQGRAPLLQVSEQLRTRGESELAAYGFAKADWFVTLHVRESGFYGEQYSSNQAHRNASIDSYLEAIRFITDAGGWVIRLGDRSMQPLPVVDRVIDYAHSDIKSAWMDVYLLGCARMFIGTTSGLTNAVISFGVPSVLVNCVSNYFQLWDDGVSFTLKPMWDSNVSAYVPLAEMITEDFRWRVFNLHQLAKEGIQPRENTAEDILLAVTEKYAELADGACAASLISKTFTRTMADAKSPGVYGAARPSRAFFEANREKFFRSEM